VQTQNGGFKKRRFERAKGLSSDEPYYEYCAQDEPSGKGCSFFFELRRHGKKAEGISQKKICGGRGGLEPGGKKERSGMRRKSDPCE